MPTPTVNFWTIDSNRKFQPVGHAATNPVSGDLCYDPETGEITRFVQGRHDRLQMWPMWMFKPVTEDRPVS